MDLCYQHGMMNVSSGVLEYWNTGMMGLEEEKN
jgi:hypothetical protein